MFMADRPLECSQCKKPAVILYKEMENDTIVCTSMCADCPILQQKLHGSGSPKEAKVSELCCGHCGTTLEAVRTGNPLGCSECYVVFSDVIVNELISGKKLPERFLAPGAKRTSLYIGKTPKLTPSEHAPTNQLMALNEALNEALKKEDYEQAAVIRDQIKSLMGQYRNGTTSK